MRLTEQSLVNKHRHCFRLENAMQVIENTRQIVNDPKSSPPLLACALLLASGRRMVEILARCSFIELHGQSYGSIVSGFVKSRHLAILDDKHLYIPLLLSFKEFKKGLTSLRKRLFGKEACVVDYPSNEVLSKRYSSQLNRALKGWLNRQDVHVHMLRALYSSLCHSLFQPHNFSLTAFINQVLGHSSIGVASHYSSVSCQGVIEGALNDGFKPHEVFTQAC
jgi:hypothetical protein